ncbi:hypothetical protein [Stenotrophomonas rhizophila]|uniref:hypothetical protein n=1 Tax=Stenotrophomonas rhizophila TaxID=216778 RepID=UPI00112F5BF3|nr:hypothetical protein [Stenotrophomonas rhizophila]
MNNVRQLYEGHAFRQTAPLENGSGGGNDGGMEARLAKLESDVDYIKRDVGEMRQALVKAADEASAARAHLATIKERLDHMPTKLNMWAAVATIVLPVGAALWWVVQQYLGPLLSKAAGG